MDLSERPLWGLFNTLLRRLHVFPSSWPLCFCQLSYNFSVRWRIFGSSTDILRWFFLERLRTSLFKGYKEIIPKNYLRKLLYYSSILQERNLGWSNVRNTAGAPSDFTIGCEILHYSTNFSHHCSLNPCPFFCVVCPTIEQSRFARTS